MNLLLSFYNYFYRLSKKSREKFILENIHLAKNTSVLLLGAGGDFYRQVLGRLDNDKIYVLDLANHIESPLVNFRSVDLNGPIPWPDNSVDLIIADQLIEHLVEVDNFLEEIYRILKKGGRFIVGTENLAHPRNIFSLALGYVPMNVSYSKQANIGNPFIPIIEASNQDPYMCHHKVFTTGALLELLKINRFRVIKKKYNNIFLPVIFKRYCYFMTYMAEKL